MSVLFLREAEVEQLLDMPTTIAVIREAFRQLAADRVQNVPRQRARGNGIILHSMSAAADYLGVVGWKQYTTTKAGAKFHVGLYEQATGSLIALIEADRLGQMRTGAVTGIAASVLANRESDRVGVLGSGWQAESQLEAVATACNTARAVVYSRDASRREAFAANMSARLGIEVVAVTEPRDAVESLPIVITATTSRTPVFDGNWLCEGALVCAIGSNSPQRAELDLTTVRRASLVVCDSVECCRQEAGDFDQAIEAGAFSWNSALDLGQVLVGSVKGRKQEDEIVVFKSVGMAIEDVAVAHEVVKLAESQSVGSTLSI